MTANVVYEVFKALSPEEKVNFLTLVQNENNNSKKEKQGTEIKTKKILLTEKEARDYIFYSVFSKPKTQNRKKRKEN
jgi:hypothetical protein